jgi:anti-anti-sigma regulatory factor
MLRITRTVLSRQEIVLHLHGRLSGLWVELLRRIAEPVLDERQVLTIDLTDVCFADCEGITVLMSLMDRGARDVNAPLFVAEQIRKCKDAGRRHANDGAPLSGGER